MVLSAVFTINICTSGLIFISAGMNRGQQTLAVFTKRTKILLASHSAPIYTVSSLYTGLLTVTLRRLSLKCDGTRAETIFSLSAKLTSPFKSAGASVQSTAGSRGVRISRSNAGCTMFRGRVKSTGYPLHSPVPPSLPLPCVTVCHHISTGL